MLRRLFSLIIWTIVLCSPAPALSASPSADAEAKALLDKAVTAMYFDDDFALAAELLGNYVAANPDADGKVYYELANACRALGRPHDAAAAYVAAALKVDNLAPDAFFKAVETLESAGLDKAADEVYDIAFAWHRDCEYWYDKMRQVYVRRYNRLIAERRFSEALALDKEQLSLMDKHDISGQAKSRVQVMSEIAQLSGEMGDTSTLLEYGVLLSGIVEKVPFAERHTSLISIPLLATVAKYYDMTGDFARADSAWVSLLRVNTSPDNYAANLTGYAAFLASYGSTDKALGLYDEAVGILRTVGDLGAAALAATDKAQCAKNVKKWDVMEQACAETADIVSEMGDGSGISDAMRWDVAYRLATFYSYAGDNDMAIKIYQELLPQYLAGKNYKQLAVTSADLGTAYAAKDMHREALECYEKAAGYIDLGAFPALNRTIKNNMAWSLYRVGQSGEALKIYSGLLDDLRNTMQHDFVYMTDSERHEFWQSQYYIFDNIHGLRLPDSEVGVLRYEAALANKGILLDTSTRLRTIIAESGDTALQADFKRLQLRLSEPRDAANNAAIEAIERNIQRRVAQIGDYTRGASVSVAEICGRLGENDRAVEIVRHVGTDGYYAYEALIMGRDGNVVVEPLPSQTMVESLDRNAIYADSTLLAGAFWSPILKHFNSSGRLYISPDGIYHSIAFEHLPLNGKPVSRTFDVVRVSSTRALVSSSIPMQGEVAVWGGLDYNVDLDADYEALGSVNSLRLGHGISPWAYLPGTRREMLAIAEVLDPSEYEPVTVTADEGTEDYFKSMSGHAPGILHVATHGFYLPSQSPEEESSLLRCGLVLSGANNHWRENMMLRDGVDDGILTAAEISRMDLSGSRVVVLSACQSGLGDIEAEGVFGLPRAFKQSGAGSIVMSLWSVDDVITQRIMTAFYQELLKGSPLRKALADACAAHGGDNPASWAAFVVID